MGIWLELGIYSKGKRARDVTGLEVAGVGGTTYIQPSNKTELNEWRNMSKNAQNLAFKQGPWPSSLLMGSAELKRFNFNSEA